MESMTGFFVVNGLLIGLDSYFSIMAARRRAGIEAPDRAADLRASAWDASAKAAHCWMLGSLFTSTGWLFVAEPFVVPESTLGRAVAALGAGLLLFGAVLFLFGISRLVTAYGLVRDARRVAEEIRP